ncbi:uncharacterized protein METZ01_LOCUS318595, partial [marine metagenome]
MDLFYTDDCWLLLPARKEAMLVSTSSLQTFQAAACGACRKR